MNVPVSFLRVIQFLLSFRHAVIGSVRGKMLISTSQGERSFELLSVLKERTTRDPILDAA